MAEIAKIICGPNYTQSPNTNTFIYMNDISREIIREYVRTRLVLVRRIEQHRLSQENDENLPPPPPPPPPRSPSPSLKKNILKKSKSRHFILF